MTPRCDVRALAPRPPFLALFAVLLFAGCLAPTLEPTGAASEATGAGGCASRVLVDHEPDLPQGGGGATSFGLVAPCRLTYRLTLRSVAGALDVMLDGPDDTGFTHRAYGAPGHAARDPSRPVESGATGVAGIYHYRYHAEHAAAFHFIATVGP